MCKATDTQLRDDSFFLTAGQVGVPTGARESDFVRGDTTSPCDSLLVEWANTGLSRLCSWSSCRLEH